jgi:hypothetical protein
MKLQANALQTLKRHEGGYGQLATAEANPGFVHGPNQSLPRTKTSVFLETGLETLLFAGVLGVPYSFVNRFRWPVSHTAREPHNSLAAFRRDFADKARS